MLRKTTLCLSLLIATSAMALDGEQAQDAFEVRHSVFELLGWNITPVARMAKKEIPFDAEQVELNASRMTALLGMIPQVFETDTRGFELDTEAKDVIWQEKAQFVDFAEAAAQKSEALEAAAATGEFGAVAAALGELGQACKDCHEQFRKD